MNMENLKLRAWRAWASAGLLAVLCAVLAVLQSRLIGEVSVAERDRLREQLQTGLNHLSVDLNDRVANACAALMPETSQFEQSGREAIYSAQYRKWRESHEALFNRIGLAVPEDGTLQLYFLNLDAGHFSPEAWPAEWAGMEDRLNARLNGDTGRSGSPRDTALIDLPRLASAGDEPGAPSYREQEWLILELNLDYIRGNLIPEMLRHYLGGDYDAAIFAENDPSTVIYHSMPGTPRIIRESWDASVGLLDNSFASMSRRPVRTAAAVRSTSPATPPASPRWRLVVRHRAGSLEQIVARARLRNVAISASILLLILATVTWLVRITRQAQRLAELQMNFVAGVSHELRTPLTVIRTAAFNLCGKIAERPDQVERYGRLIQDESEKLAVLVEQILRYGRSRTGAVIQDREPVSMESLIDDGLRSSRISAGNPGLIVEKQIEPGLPLVLADEQALKHAFKNLVDNAVKYGTEGNNWIGIYACAVEDSDGQVVEFKVADRGPGIPLEEQAHIFDPFFRGRRAVEDQIHGTGLGLNLVKKIVEAHGGTITLKSEPMKGAEFTVRLPAAPPGLQDEFAHSLS